MGKEQVKQGLEQLLKEETDKFEASIAWIKVALKNLSNNGENHVNSAPVTHITPKKKAPKGQKDTFMSRVATVLKEQDEPMTIIEMIDKMTQKYATKYEYRKFSGALSVQYKKNYSLVNQEKITDFPISCRYLYTLKEWYDSSNKLKGEYWLKIQKRRENL